MNVAPLVYIYIYTAIDWVCSAQDTTGCSTLVMDKLQLSETGMLLCVADGANTSRSPCVEPPGGQ